jgi:hypothetical protein
MAHQGSVSGVMMDMNKINDPYHKTDILAAFGWVNREVFDAFDKIPAGAFFQTSAEGGRQPRIWCI